MDINNDSETTFSNEAIELSELPKFEEVNLQPISPLYRKVLQYNWLISTIIIVGITTIIAGFSTDWTWCMWIPIGIVILLSLGILWLNIISIRKRKYAIRTHDVIYHYGRLSCTYVVIPYTRIQHVAIHESWLAKKWHLAQLKIYTTGDTTIIAGLEKAIAYQLQSLILSKLKKKADNNNEVAESLHNTDTHESSANI